MLDFETEKLLLLYLKNAYPIKRLNYGGRFRRAIIISAEKIFFLRDKSNFNESLANLSRILARTFHLKPEETINALKIHLNIRY